MTYQIKAITINTYFACLKCTKDILTVQLLYRRSTEMLANTLFTKLDKTARIFLLLRSSIACIFTMQLASKINVCPMNNGI